MKKKIYFLLPPVRPSLPFSPFAQQPPPAISVPLLLPFVPSRSPAADPFPSVSFPPQPSRSQPPVPSFHFLLPFAAPPRSKTVPLPVQICVAVVLRADLPSPSPFAKQNRRRLPNPTATLSFLLRIETAVHLHHNRRS